MFPDFLIALKSASDNERRTKKLKGILLKLLLLSFLQPLIFFLLKLQNHVDS